MNSGEIHITKMLQKHIPALCRLELECFSQPWSMKSLESQLSNPVARFFVALLENETAGYIGMAHVQNEAYIHNIAVFGCYRRKGIASALLKKVDEYALKSRLESVSLEVRASNNPAILLYEKSGYTFEGVRPGFYQFPDENAFIYTKRYSTDQSQSPSP